jgi:hypothetical protein
VKYNEKILDFLQGVGTLLLQAPCKCTIKELCSAAMFRDRSTISELILKVADIENEACEILKSFGK